MSLTPLLLDNNIWVKDYNHSLIGAFALIPSRIEKYLSVLQCAITGVVLQTYSPINRGRDKEI